MIKSLRCYKIKNSPNLPNLTDLPDTKTKFVMKYNKVEEMPIWIESMSLVSSFYNLIKTNSLLRKDFALLDQMKRSVISIPSNISEWFARKTNIEFKRFLDIALGSLSEFKTQIYICNMVWIHWRRYFRRIFKKNIINWRNVKM